MGTAQTFQTDNVSSFSFLEFSKLFEKDNYGNIEMTLDANKNVVDIQDEFVTSHDWLDEIKEELNELESLDENWDSYDAPKIDKNLISSAENLLADIYSHLISPPKPFIVPVINGSIDIEWEYGNKYFALKLREENWRFYYSNRNDRSDREKGDSDKTFEKIQPILKKYLKLVYGREM